MLFENSHIDLDQLPQVEATPLQSLAPAYPKVMHIGNVILYSILGLILLPVWFKTELSTHPLAYIVPLIWVFLYLSSTFLVSWSYRVQGYAIRERDIIYRRGVFFRKTTVIPFNRVQHCEVKQGPVERFFNLSSLEVYTAGGQSSDLRIPGLAGDLASQLKSFIIKRTAAHEDH
ncbi:MAG: PH domain-containing protein [Bacteroidota bacterium]